VFSKVIYRVLPLCLIISLTLAPAHLGDPKSWNYEGMKVEYCLSEVPRERCRLQLSLPIAIIVVFFNAMKAICMVTMLLRLGEKMSSPPIMNLGDTVTSFLERSDPQTKNMSLTSLDNLRKSLNMRHQWDTRAREVKGRPAFRFGAASRTRWIVTVVLCASPVRRTPAYANTSQ
jgi:hypothetical protein